MLASTVPAFTSTSSKTIVEVLIFLPKVGYRKSKTGRAFLKSATGYAVKNCWWLAHPLLPANGLSVALQ